MTTTEVLPGSEQAREVEELRTQVAELAEQYYPALDADPSVRLSIQPLELEIPDTPKGYDVLVLDCSELPSGSFKRLGAMVGIAEAQKSAEANGTPLTHVSAATDGNHGKAVVSVAEEMGLGVTICVPKFVDQERLQYFRDRGIEPDNSYETLEEAKEAAKVVGKQPGGAYVEPFDHATTMAGNGYPMHVLGKYLQKHGLTAQYAGVDAFVATAGGGLTAGSDMALNHLGLGKEVNLHGAQLRNCDVAARALYDRTPLSMEELDTSCTSTALLVAGQKTLLELRNSMDDETKSFTDMEVVTREELGEAMLTYGQTYGRTGPAASLALAAAVKTMREQGAPQDGQRRLMLVVRCAADDVTDENYDSYMAEVSDDFRQALTSSAHNKAVVRAWREAEVARNVAAFRELSRRHVELANSSETLETSRETFAANIGTRSVAALLNGPTRRRQPMEAANRKTA